MATKITLPGSIVPLSTYPGNKSPQHNKVLVQHWDPYISLLMKEKTLSVDGQRQRADHQRLLRITLC